MLKHSSHVRIANDGGVTGVLRIARISAYFRCGNAKIERHFCGLRIFVAFLRNADILCKINISC